MRKFWMLLAGSASLLLLAAGAQGLPYTGTLELDVGTFDSFLIPGNGNGVSSGTTVSLGSANFTTTTTVPVSDPSAPPASQYPAFPVVAIGISGPGGLAGGSFTSAGGGAGNFGGSAGLTGVAKVGVGGPPATALASAFLDIPLPVVGVENGQATVIGSRVSVTVFGAGWTTGQVKVIGTAGFFDGVTLFTATGANNRTAGGRGQIVLVTPTLVRTNVPGIENVPLVGTLTLNYVPEPGTLLLLGSGVTCLAAFARRRERR